MRRVISQLNHELRECVQHCLDCHEMCLETLMYCLGKGGRHSEPNHIKMLLECSHICQTSAEFMIIQSNFHSKTCEICSEICDHCAKYCEQFHDDEQMQACAEICAECAESCHKMAGAENH